MNFHELTYFGIFLLVNFLQLLSLMKGMTANYLNDPIFVCTQTLHCSIKVCAGLVRVVLACLTYRSLLCFKINKNFTNLKTSKFTVIYLIVNLPDCQPCKTSDQTFPLLIFFLLGLNGMEKGKRTKCSPCFPCFLADG